MCVCVTQLWAMCPIKCDPGLWVSCVFRPAGKTAEGVNIPNVKDVCIQNYVIPLFEMLTQKCLILVKRADTFLSVFKMMALKCSILVKGLVFEMLTQKYSILVKKKSSKDLSF